MTRAEEVVKTLITAVLVAVAMLVSQGCASVQRVLGMNPDECLTQGQAAVENFCARQQKAKAQGEDLKAKIEALKSTVDAIR